MKKPPDFVAYDIGDKQAFVCSSLPPESTAERMDTANPTGKKKPWQVAGGPRPCGFNPDTHKHYTLTC